MRLALIGNILGVNASPLYDLETVCPQRDSRGRFPEVTIKLFRAILELWQLLTRQPALPETQSSSMPDNPDASRNLRIRYLIFLARFLLEQGYHLLQILLLVRKEQLTGRWNDHRK